MSALRKWFGALGMSLRKSPRLPGVTMAATGFEGPETGFEGTATGFEGTATDDDRVVKCVAVGDSAVGKSSLLVRYTDDYFVFNSQDMPAGPVFDSDTGHPVALEVAGVNYSLVLFDTFGQPQQETMRVACYPGTDVCLLCFSVVCPASFENIETRWMPEVRRHLPRTPLILVGTQTDLRDDLSVVQHLGKSREFPVDHDEGEKMARRIKAKCYLECSALTMKGIKQVFDVATLKALRKRNKLKSTRAKRVRNFLRRLRKIPMRKRESSSPKSGNQEASR